MEPDEERRYEWSGISCNRRVVLIWLSSAQNKILKLLIKSGSVFDCSVQSKSTPCPRKKEASSFSTINVAFLDRFS